MMDVDYDLFWVLNPKELTPFVRAFSMKRKSADISAWQLGMYVRSAIASCFIKDSKYPTEPMLSHREETPEEIQARIKQRFLDQVKRVNACF